MAAVNVWTFYESLPVDGSERDRLRQVERDVASICDLRQEVNSGGFDLYLRYWGGNAAGHALASVGAILGREWSDLLEEAMTLLGAEYPADPNERFELVEVLDLGDRFQLLDKRFYELEASTAADELLSEHLGQQTV